MEESVLHIELLNWPVAGDSNREHRANGGRFHNRAGSLIVVDFKMLSETSEDTTTLVVIKGPVGTKLVREDPLAGDDVGATGSGDKLQGPITNQGHVLVLHSRAPIGVDKRSMYRGSVAAGGAAVARGIAGDSGATHGTTSVGVAAHGVAGDA
jgi:hypothetical protein